MEIPHTPEQPNDSNDRPLPDFEWFYNPVDPSYNEVLNIVTASAESNSQEAESQDDKSLLEQNDTDPDGTNVEKTEAVIGSLTLELANSNQSNEEPSVGQASQNETGLAVEQGEISNEATDSSTENDSPKPNTFIGQHILTDPEVLAKISDNLSPDILSVEIGGGPGTLTKELIKTGSPVIVYEVDERWAPDLEQLSESGDLTIKWESFLNASPEELNELGDFQLVGNIPFHISEPLMNKMTEVEFNNSVLLVGDRLATSLTAENPDQPGWRRMSLLSNAYFKVDRVADVPRESFEPAPRVDGAVVKITRLEAIGEEWKKDATIQSYRALVEAGRNNSTTAKALKRVMVNERGQAIGVGSANVDKRQRNKSERASMRASLKSYAGDYNNGGRNFELQKPAETMLSIVAPRVDERVLSKPLNALSNQELKGLCSSISSAINRRKNR